jgi:site-specific DNA recombinase
VRYRYYISQPRQRGHSDAPVGSISRVPADQIEALVTRAVRDRLLQSGDGSQSPSEQNAVAAYIAKVEVRASQLAVTMKAIAPTSHHDRELPHHDDADTTLDQGEIILIPWTKPPMRKFRDVIQPASASTQRTRPIRAERRAGLIRAIARGRHWLDEVLSRRLTIDEIAVRQKCSVRQINLTLSMAFLAPPLVKAAIEGRLPCGIGIAKLRDAPCSHSGGGIADDGEEELATATVNGQISAP